MSATPRAEADVRGVYFDAENFPGMIAYRVVDSTGRVRLRVEMQESDEEPGEVTRLWEWLDRHDPPAPALRIVPPGQRPKRSREKSKPPTLQLA